MLGVVIAVVVAVVVIVFLVAMARAYNGLVRKRNAVDNAWAQIDVQLKRRHDLIPNLVSSVKGYATHEQSTLDAITQARAAAMSAQSPVDRAQAEDALSGVLHRFVAVAESYPELKASQSFLQLQEELADSENRIAYSRQYYDDVVLTYNNAIQTLMTSVVAAVGGFRAREPFRAAPDETGPVQVSFP